MELTFCLSLIFLVEISLARQVMVGPPTWKANKDNSTLITAMFGKFVVFKCPAQGNPKPNITWFKNNQLIDSNNTNNKYRIKRWKFKIKHVDIKDNGNYTCVVENEYGKITWTYQLKLKQGPPKRATSKGSSKIITELTGHEANLNCLAYGFPEPNITWFKNGNLIDLSHVKYRTLEGILRIMGLQIINFGKYKCVVQKEHGRLKWNYKLRVNDYMTGTPTVLGERHIMPAIGETVSLVCYIIRPDIRPQWVKHHEVNGSTLAPHYKQYLYLLPPSPTTRQNIAIVDLFNVSMEDSGLYSCIVPYHRRWSSETVYVQVKEKSRPGEPVFQMPRFINRKAFENGSKSLICKAKGNPTPSVQWYKDGVAISNNKRYRITKNALIIDPVTKNDSAVFKCRAWNSAGSKSHSYTLTVIPAVPAIEGIYHTKSLGFENKSTALGCRVHGHPRPTIRWYKDGVIIPPRFDERYKIRRDYMEIIELNKTDSGNFICFAWNANGNSQRIFSLLVVSESDYNDTQDSYERCDDVTEGAPQWNRPKAKSGIITRKIGESVELECHACGNPLPNIFWYQNKNYLDPSIVTKKYKIEARNRKLKIMNLRKRDNGDYTCIAENQHGRILRLHKLKIKKNPPTFLGPVNTTALAGTSVTLECRTEVSFKVTHFQWMKYYQVNGAYETRNGTPYLTIIQISALNQTDPHLLRFENVTKDDAGSYVCQVSNAGGVSSRRMWLTVVDDLVT